MMGAPERIALIKEGLAALDVPSLDSASVKLQRTRSSVTSMNLDSEQVHTFFRVYRPISHSPQTSKIMGQSLVNPRRH